MTTITIRERTSLGPNGENATVSFDNGPQYDITVSDPFSEQQEQQLEWYFEEHLVYPFKDQVKAEQCAKSVTKYGETLFKQVFLANPEVYPEYKECVRNGLNNVQIEIAGSPSFHRWHWESLKDPKMDRPLVLQATLVRKNLQPQNTKITLRPSTTINILVVTARPSGKGDVGYRTISRPMVEALSNANVPVQIDILRPGTYKALYDKLRETTSKHGVGYYHVVHFDLHGGVLSYEQYDSIQEQLHASPQLFKGNARYGRPEMKPYEGKKAFLSFEDVEDDKADLVEASELAGLLVEHAIPINILNACQSGKQVGASETSLGSRLIQHGVQMVLAMSYSVTVSAARLLMETLYTQLFAKHDLATSIRFARQELYNSKQRQAHFQYKIDLEDWLLPVVYQNQPQNLTVREFTPEEATAYYTRQAERDKEKPNEPAYGFVGRDVDILQLEKRLLTKRNIVLVRGMGGAGKTTLLQHLRTWWQTTGLVDSVFYFGYDEKAWNRQQILDAIARKLLTPEKYATFQSLPLDAQQSLLTQRLRSEWHLLILDNLESITGSPLAIQNTLPQEERDALHRFLMALQGGKTLVLLGSRNGEAWLAQHTFDDNIHDLSGLDFEAASTLADLILARYHVTKYRTDPDLLRLLKLLDGFPLALEVILPNLAHQTPKQILEGLQAGDINLDKGDTQKKTESIIQCIDYSYRNLSPEAQQLLLCLAPFTSVIFQGGIEQYIQQLRQQTALADLPLKRLPEVIQEAQNWGLLSSDPDIRVYLHLQPVLPYFLHNLLNVPEQVAIKEAIETAFRLHYDEFGNDLVRLLISKEPQEQMVGQGLMRLEYENLMVALDLALDTQVSILPLYGALSGYLHTIQDQKRGLALGEQTLQRLEQYSAEKLQSEFIYEFVSVVDNAAGHQLSLKQYTKADISYKKALNILLTNETNDEKMTKRLIASIYHSLGTVALQQRQWEQAELYYQQALHIFIEYGDRYEEAETYHHLGIIAQKQQQSEQAERYLQQALQIKIELEKRYEQANTYGQLGNVAQEHRRWKQAKLYYQQALHIFIEYRDRYSQANIYCSLGLVAFEQQQWEQSEYYLQQGLQIEIEFDDPYSQASTYHNLGRVAQEQHQWKQAQSYFLKALEMYGAYEVMYNSEFAFSGLARLWQQANEDRQIVDRVVDIVGGTHEEVVELFRRYLEGSEEKGERKKRKARSRKKQ